MFTPNRPIDSGDQMKNGDRRLRRRFPQTIRRCAGVLLLAALIPGPRISLAQSDLSARTGVYDTDRPPASFFRANRMRLLALMADSSSLLVYAAPVRPRNGDMNYRYRQDDNFWYLTGCDESDALLLLSKNAVTITDSAGTPIRTVHEILFVSPKNPSAERWTGKTLGPGGAEELLGIECARTTQKADLMYVQKAIGRSAVVYLPPPGEARTGELNRILQDLAGVFKRFESFHEIRTPEGLINRLREVKSPDEIALVRKAVDISVEGHRAMLALCRPGRYEYELQAAFESAITSRGAESVAYPSIVGSGENSTILHYLTNRKQIRSGEVIVLDCGAEYHNYAADITRTIPADGHFTSAQRELYDIVLKAQNEAIAMLRPGVRYFPDVQAKATAVIRDGLLRLGVIRDSAQVSKYFIHGLGHPIGLDVHDVRSEGPLKEGEIWTVEPGIYIPEDARDVDQKYRGIGIRIEDDLLITGDGSELLSRSLPRGPDDIEAAMAGNGKR